MNEDFWCPKESAAHLLYPAQAGVCLEALFPERLYLATSAPRSVSHPPIHREKQLMFLEKSHDYP
jgi:hypothetical protein